jgi:hypothetical protein
VRQIQLLRGESVLPTKQTNLLAARVRGSPVRGTRQGGATLAPRFSGVRESQINLRSTDGSTKDAHIIASRDLSGLFGREATSQHRCDEMHPLRVVLETGGTDLLVSADANVLDADDINHFFQAIDIFFEARKEVPDADCAACLSDHARVVVADLPCRERRRTHRRGPSNRGMGQEQGLGRDFDRLLHSVFGRMRNVADKPEPVARADYLGPVRGEPLMRETPVWKSPMSFGV